MKRFLIGLVIVIIFSPLSGNSAVMGDINQDGKIDLMESIYALQVASGIYPAIDDSCLLTGQGVWAGGQDYYLCDVVTHSNITYACTTAHMSDTNTNAPPDTTYWTVLSIKGDTGATGVQGPSGPSGPSGPVGQAKGLSIGNEVTRSIGGETYIWLDRNLGASRVATAYNDTLAYGDLYQWGRGVDGHENRTSQTTTVLSSSDAPKHDNFIIIISPSPYDWRSPQNDNLWQGVNGINNPCPAGFRLPTSTEWETEHNSWGVDNQNRQGAFASSLKLVAAGYRSRNNGTVNNAGSSGFCWSGTVNGSSSRNMDFSSTSTSSMQSNSRTFGMSVRCIKD